MNKTLTIDYDEYEKIKSDNKSLIDGSKVPVYTRIVTRYDSDAYYSFDSYVDSIQLVDISACSILEQLDFQLKILTLERDLSSEKLRAKKLESKSKKTFFQRLIYLITNGH